MVWGEGRERDGHRDGEKQAGSQGDKANRLKNSRRETRDPG